ncbi:ABC transporter permease [Sporosarcina sp. Te-1]|uniref:ABC transporter permease n=1 Tax=Sporosarcina sp. Te-1 TaxID=2818390 RepID=UPI001A9D140F|nr:ABC transporter permease [Sporosarcina sp. Te-1]QTD41299.1 ABC transporter permease [Sporosarcina sp. Te-1]
MHAIRNTIFFMKEDAKQLKKKWGTLLLLFLFPLFLIALVLLLVAGILIPDEEEPIRVAIVDEDQTKESKLISKLLVETASGNSFLQMTSASMDEAERLMKEDKISTYFSLPPEFTEKLYEGESVTLPIVGNPSRPVDSYLTKELIDSLARYIASAQANILTINEFAKETPMSREERLEMMFSQFMNFTLFTLGKDKLVDEEVIMNAATSAPKNYYMVSGWFISLTVWILGVYNVLQSEERPSMTIRLRLLGVTGRQRTFSRLSMSVLYSMGLAIPLFIGLIQFADVDFYIIDYVRVFLFISLYGLTLASCFALIGVWFRSGKTILFLQCSIGALAVFLSGAIVPVLYFPQSLQPIFPYVFSYSDLKWVMELVLEGRNYANYTVAAFQAIAFMLLLFLSLTWKERRRVV